MKMPGSVWAPVLLLPAVVLLVAARVALAPSTRTMHLDVTAPSAAALHSTRITAVATPPRSGPARAHSAMPLQRPVFVVPVPAPRSPN